VRAIALHEDVLVVTSAVLRVNCVIVRGHDGGSPVDGAPGAASSAASGERTASETLEGSGDETFVIDSPVLPDELAALPALVEQASFPTPGGLLATHGDWDHLLGRLAFPAAALGCAESTAGRMQANPGEAQRDLRTFDEGLMIERSRPLALGSLQALPVPGVCSLGTRELELHETGGHTADGMAILAPWAGVLAVGDYLSSLELPMLSPGGSVEAYLDTLERLRGLVARVEHVVPGHGPTMDPARAGAILEQDVEYVRALGESGDAAELPDGRRGAANRRLHAANVAAQASAR
jgi:glyoxylase-like metal-dependent hydrolase (beta-lactamase superfamily II)